MKMRNKLLKKPRKVRLEYVIERCKCRECLSWVECGERGAYCLPGSEKSECIKIEEGCLCKCCPVQKIMDYGHSFYCIRGNDKKQRTGRVEKKSK